MVTLRRVLQAPDLLRIILLFLLVSDLVKKHLRQSRQIYAQMGAKPWTLDKMVVCASFFINFFSIQCVHIRNISLYGAVCFGELLFCFLLFIGPSIFDGRPWKEWIEPDDSIFPQPPESAQSQGYHPDLFRFRVENFLTLLSLFSPSSD